MNQRQFIGLGYGLIGGLLLFGDLLLDVDAIFTSSMALIPSLVVLLGILGCIGMIVIGVSSLVGAEGRLGLGQEANSRPHLYLIWVSALLVAAGVVV